MILLALAIGYMNNLLYVFVFLLISMALTSMWTTNQNVVSLELENLTANNVFANEENSITAWFKNKNQRASIWDLQAKIRFDSDERYQNIPQIKPFQSEHISILWSPTTRGLLTIPYLHIQSRFPFRLLVSWKYVQKDVQVMVYPQRKGKNYLPQVAGSSAQDEANAVLDSEGFFRDYREFQRTDSPSRIAWKKSLKIQKHLVKNFESSGQKKVLIDWNMTKDLTDPEDRISQLALWIDVCHNNHSIYSLKIKDYQTTFASGLQHYKQCMQKLALLTPDEYK